MKTEILKAVEKRHSKNKDLSKILKKIESELTILSETEGIGAKNNLDTFYNIYYKIGVSVTTSRRTRRTN